MTQQIGYLNNRTRAFFGDFVLPPSRHQFTALIAVNAVAVFDVAIPGLEFQTLQSGDNLPYAFLAVVDLTAVATQVGAGTLFAAGQLSIQSSYGEWQLLAWQFATAGAGQTDRVALFGPLIYERPIGDRNQPFFIRVRVETFTQAGGAPTANVRAVVHFGVLYAEQQRAQELVCPARSLLGDMAPIG